MRRLLLWGCGECGKKAVETLSGSFGENDRIIGFIDNEKEGMYLGYPIQKIGNTVLDSDIYVIICIDNCFSVVSVYQQCKKNGIDRIYWFNQYYGMYRKNDFLSMCIDCNSWGELVLPHGEIHVIDKCNLNCKKCMHFSTLEYESELISIDSVKETISKIMSKITAIAHFSILGGEPLLREDLDEFISVIRELLPNTELFITTNGLLIPKLSSKVIECIKENRVVFGISNYPPTKKMEKEIISFLEDKGLAYMIYDVDEFCTPLSTVENSKYLAKRCLSDGCTHLRDKKVARCPMLMYIENVNKRFNTNYPSDGIIDLDSDVTGEELLKQLRERVGLCDYCIEYKSEWEHADIKDLKLKDFVLIEE